MDESLEIKHMQRETVEILVATELVGLCTEASTVALDSLHTGKYSMPDTKKWARRIIAIVNEHSR